MTAVLVINADLGPLHRVSLRHAIRLVFRQKAVIHEAVPDQRIGIYEVPTVVRLVHYVVTRWRRGKGPAWSRAGVLARDERRCAYCCGPANTIDHIVPRSRGGTDTWLNTVAACARCNNRKGSKLLSEARLALVTVPAVPTWASLMAR